MRRSLLLLLILTAFFTACSSYQIRGEFDESLDAYNQLLRWQRWDKASLFTSDSIRKEFEASVVAAKDIRMVECRVVGKAYNEGTREAFAEVAIDYYNVHSYTMRTLLYKQKWAYLEEQGTKSWRLMSPLPAFR